MKAMIFPRSAALLALLSLGCQGGSAQPILSRGQSPIVAPDIVQMPAHLTASGSPATLTPPTIPSGNPAPAASPVIQTGATPNDAETQIRVVAVVGSDLVITDDEVWQMVRQRAREYIHLSPDERSVKEKEFFREELRRLIERELIISDFLGKVRKNAPAKVPEIHNEARKMADKQLKAFQRENKLTTEAEFLASLKAQGLSRKGISRQLERGAMMNMYLSQVMRDKVHVATLAEVALYYQAHPDEFHVDDHLKWLDLFVSYSRFATTAEARDYANQLHQHAKAGADFVKLVKERGHGDSVLRDGEGIGHKPGEIQPARLEPTLLGLQEGEISEPISTETGVHILKMAERTVAGIRPFDVKTQTAIRARLEQLARKQEFDKLVEELWRKTTVQVIDLP